MSPSNKKKLLISVVVGVVCVAAIALTLALTLGRGDGTHVEVEKPPALVKGELDVKLVRERLQSMTVDRTNGLPAWHEDDRFADFSKSADNIFGINDDILIGPNSYFVASMAISNNKPYAFEYWLEIVPQNGDNLLVDQLELTVTIDNETFVKRTLRDGLSTKIFPAVLQNSTSRFSVKLEYLNLNENDKTKNTTLAFDLTVHARLIQS